VLVAGVVHDQVEDHPDAPGVGLGHQPVEVGLRSEPRIDGRVIGHVVSDVVAGRRVDRGQPDRVDAQVDQVLESVDDAGEVAGAVPVAVLEAARVDLVDDAVAPPVDAVTTGRRGRRRVLAVSAHRTSPAVRDEPAGARTLRGQGLTTSRRVGIDTRY
jgi:hypothetical protein